MGYWLARPEWLPARRQGAHGATLLFLLAPLVPKQKALGNVAGNCCGDLAGSSKHPNRAPAHSIEVRGNIAHWLLWPEGSYNSRGAPAAS